MRRREQVDKMETLEDLFRILSFVPKDYKNIKYFHIGHQPLVTLALLVLDDDRVICNYNYKKNVKNWDIVKELCGKKIVEFYEGNYWMFARSADNLIYTWCVNHFVHIRPTTEEDECHIPRKEEFFDNKNIVQIRCSNLHCLALSSDGRVYGWTINIQENKNVIYPPIQLGITHGVDTKIKSIDIYEDSSLLVTYEGRIIVMEWDFRNPKMFDTKLIHATHKEIQPSPIQMAMIYSRFLYFLNEQGEVIVYEKDGDNFMFRLCVLPNKVTDIMKLNYQLHNRYDSLLMENVEKAMVYDYKSRQIYRSKHSNIFEYFAREFQNTCQTVEVVTEDDQRHLYVNEVVVNGSDNGENVQDYLTSRRRLVYECKVINPLLAIREPTSDLKEFKFFNDLSQTIKCQVKCCYVSGVFASTNYFAFIIMNDDNVFTIGMNENDKLGIPNCTMLEDYQKIEDLSEKKIEEFYEGFDCMFARTMNGDIYGWGRNDKGQLCIGEVSKEFDVVGHRKIDKLSKLKIVRITCGYWQFFALTYDCKVYAWGDNQDGSLGVIYEEIVTYPIRIMLLGDSETEEDDEELDKEENQLDKDMNGDGEDAEELGKEDKIEEAEDRVEAGGVQMDELVEHSRSLKVKYVECNLNQVFVITTEGLVFKWSFNLSKYTDDCNVPKFVWATNITKAICKESDMRVLYMINDDGELHVCNNLDEVVHIEFEHAITDIYSNNMFNKFKIKSYPVIKTDRGIYEIKEHEEDLERIEFVKTNFINYYEYCTKELKTLPKTLHMTPNGYLKTQELVYDEDSEQLYLKFENVFDMKYETLFTDHKLIGQGGFGKVYRVKDITDINRFYAIKRIYLEG